MLIKLMFGEFMSGNKTANILVVDDEELLVRLNKRQLENYGHSVSVATESLEALRMITEEPERFNLMVTDLMMPKMSGRDLIEKVLELAPLLPVIVFTGLKEENMVQELNDLGVKEIVEKPVIDNELMNAVQKVLAGREL